MKYKAQTKLEKNTWYKSTMAEDTRVRIKKWREQIPEFLKFLGENPDIEKAYMDNIREIARKNIKGMNSLYNNLIKSAY